MECQTIVHWYWLYKPVGLNHDVSLLHLLRGVDSADLHFLKIEVSWHQNIPNYLFFFPTNGFLHTMKMPGFIGLKLWQRGLESMRHHFHTWRPQPHRRSLICTGKKMFGKEEKNHCKWLLGLKDVQRNVAFLYICWRDWVLCFSWWWQEKYTAMLSVVILPPYVAWPFMLPRWRALCFAAFCALGVFRDESKWTRKVGGGALKLSQLSFSPSLIMFTLHGALDSLYFFYFCKDHIIIIKPSFRCPSPAYN